MSAQPITIRSLGPEDADVLSRVRPGTFDRPVDPALAWRFLVTGVNEISVALAGGEVVGFASGTVLMHPDKPPAFFVNEVGVHPEFRRRGIARDLVERLLDVARGRGCEGIWLATETDNAPARALYRTLGARETEGYVLFDWDDAVL